MIFPARRRKSKITADRANGLKMRFDTHATPDEALWCEAFLDTGRERQLLVHLLLPLFQLLVRFAKLLLGSLLFGNLRKCDYAELKSSLFYGACDFCEQWTQLAPAGFA
jgi:hypothetical protein